MSTLPRRFKRNALSNYATAFASVVLAIAVTPLMVRGLGKTAYGVWGLATSTVLYFDLLKFGFGRASVRYVAMGAEREDDGLVRRTIATSTFSLLVPAALVLLLSPAMALLFPVIFDVPSDLTTPAMVIVVLSAVDLAFAIPSDTFGSTLIGLQRYDLLNVTLVGTSVAQAAAWAVVILLDGGLVAIGVATLTFSLVGQTARYVLARRLLRTGLLSPRDFDRGMVRPLLSMSSWIAVTEIADTVIARIDAAVVGIIAGVPQAAVYLVGQKLALLASRFTSPVAALFYPHASALAASDDREALRETVFAGTRITVAIAAPIMLVLAVLAKPALTAWVGPGFEDAAPVVIYLSATLVVATIPRTAIYVLRGMGDVRVPALMTVAEAAINLPLSVGLGLAIGFEGVALGTLIATAIISLGFLLPYSCRRAGLSTLALVVATARTNVPPSLASLAVGLLLQSQGVHGIVEVIAAGLAMVAVFLLVLFAVGLSPAERTRVLTLARLRRGATPA